MFLRKYNSALFVCVIASLLAAGCGDSGPPKADISGRVALDGAPLTGVSIRFIDQGGRGGGFNLEADGSFVGDRPLAVGEYGIEICPPWPVAGDSPEERTVPKDESGKVPAIYLKAATSGLKATVVEDDSQNVFEFSLSSKLAGSTAGAAAKRDRAAEPIAPEYIP